MYKGVPNIRKRLIGGRLKRLRENRGLSVEEVAASLGVGGSAIRRQESGHTAVSVPDAMAYAKLYGIEEDAETTGRLISMAKQGRKRGWWSDYGATTAPDFVDFADAEDLSTEIWTFQPLVVPGIFQTQKYSQTVIEMARPLRYEGKWSAEDNMAIREKRKAILTREDPPQVWAVIGEAAVLTAVGGVEVMRDQLQHLLELGERPNFSIQMLPFSAGAHLGMGGSFVIMGFDDTPDGLIMLERVTAVAFNDDPATVRIVANRFAHIRGQSLSSTDTARYLQTVISQL